MVFFLFFIYFLLFLGGRGGKRGNLGFPFWHSEEITLPICFVARFFAGNRFVMRGSSVGEDLVTCCPVDDSHWLLHTYSFMLTLHWRCALFSVAEGWCVCSFPLKPVGRK